MNRIAATLDESQNPVETTFAARNSKRCTRFKAKFRQSDDVRQLATTKAAVVRDIEKNSVLLDRGGCSLSPR